MTPNPRVVLVEHHDSYVGNLAHLVAAVTGVLADVVQHDATTVADVLSYDRVVLSPGPGHPLEPGDFAIGSEVLREATVPVLGVCLGMQGLVTTYGGIVERVRPAHDEVASVHHDGTGVFAGIPSPYPAVRYHSLAATDVPDDPVTATCRDEDQRTVAMGSATGPVRCTACSSTPSRSSASTAPGWSGTSSGRVTPRPGKVGLGADAGVDTQPRADGRARAGAGLLAQQPVSRRWAHCTHLRP